MPINPEIVTINKATAREKFSKFDQKIPLDSCISDAFQTYDGRLCCRGQYPPYGYVICEQHKCPLFCRANFVNINL